MMKSLGELYRIGQAAEMAGMTSEALRHYDRIGLVRPSERDGQSNYRYYTKQDIVRLNTIQALRLMDLSLEEIKEVLSYDRLDKIIAFLDKAQVSADDKIARLQYAKAKIELARADYEKKLQCHEEAGDLFTRAIPERVILLSDSMRCPTLNNLWNYHRHFYDQLTPAQRQAFSFEDTAGIYSQGDCHRLFAVCLRYTDAKGLKTLPGGTYLCVNCSEDTKEAALKSLLAAARARGSAADFVIHRIVVCGILQWTYQIQVYLEAEG